MTTHDKLTRLHNRGTLYELVVNSQYLAGYCRHGKPGILGMLRQHGDAWAARIGKDDLIVFARDGRSCQLGSFRIAFSGRTQRSAITEGELPWALDQIEPV
jgi:hypothetical protein